MGGWVYKLCLYVFFYVCVSGYGCWCEWVIAVYRCGFAMGGGLRV